LRTGIARRLLQGLNAALEIPVLAVGISLLDMDEKKSNPDLLRIELVGVSCPCSCTVIPARRGDPFTSGYTEMEAAFR
jgi:hypothetical protein